MEQIKKLEDILAGWYKSFPHLPKNGQKWLAENAWWITAVGAVILALGVFSLIGIAQSANETIDSLNRWSKAFTGTSIDNHIDWTWMLVAAFEAVVAVIYGLAVMPLKGMKKKGWDLMFIGFLVGAGLSIADGIYYGVGSLIGSLIGLIIGAYFLFETRTYFKGADLKIESKE